MLNVIEMPNESNALADPTHSGLRRAHELIQQKVNRGAVRQFAEVMTINPDIAAVLLARNPKDENRKLTISRVRTYAKDMADGLWDGMNGQTIVVSKDGYLNDGQHRLNAIIAADAHISMLIVFGAERDSRLTLDQNKARTPGDYVTMVGVANGNNIAAAARILYAYDHVGKREGQWHINEHVSKRALHSYIMANEETLVWAIHVCDVKGFAKVSPLSRLAAATAVLHRGGASEEAIKNFMRSIVNGDGLGKTSPAYVARERLIYERMRGRVPVERVIEIIVRAWNAHRTGKRMTRLALTGRLPNVER